MLKQLTIILQNKYPGLQINYYDEISEVSAIYIYHQNYWILLINDSQIEYRSETTHSERLMISSNHPEYFQRVNEIIKMVIQRVCSLRAGFIAADYYGD